MLRTGKVIAFTWGIAVEKVEHSCGPRFPRWINSRRYSTQIYMRYIRELNETAARWDAEWSHRRAVFLPIFPYIERHSIFLFVSSVCEGLRATRTGGLPSP